MLNKVTLIGNLGADPELKHTQSGQSVCNFSLATTKKWTDQAGQKQEKTEWHRIVVWGKQADSCGQYLAKGRQAYVEGELQTREYEKDGIKRYVTEIVASQILFLGGVGQQNGQASQQGRGAAPAQGRGSYQGRGQQQAPAQQQPDDGFDDVPF